MTTFIGTVASIFVVISISFTTKTKRGTIALRLFNMLGSMLFVYYGFKIGAWPVLGLNAYGTFINGFYLIKTIKGGE